MGIPDQRLGGGSYNDGRTPGFLVTADFFLLKNSKKNPVKFLPGLFPEKAFELVADKGAHDKESDIDHDHDNDPENTGKQNAACEFSGHQYPGEHQQDDAHHNAGDETIFKDLPVGFLSPV
jgi:hypothetical protein